MNANGAFIFLTLTVLCFFGTIWFVIWAIFVGARRRSAHRDLEARFQALAAEHERQKKNLVETILQYDARIEQVERELGELRRHRYAAGAEAEVEARLGRSA